MCVWVTRHTPLHIPPATHIYHNHRGPQTGDLWHSSQTALLRTPFVRLLMRELTIKWDTSHRLTDQHIQKGHCTQNSARKARDKQSCHKHTHSHIPHKQKNRRVSDVKLQLSKILQHEMEELASREEVNKKNHYKAVVFLARFRWKNSIRSQKQSSSQE